MRFTLSHLAYCLIIGGCLWLSACQASDTGSTVLAEQFQSQDFSIRYPSDWQYQIPQANMLFMASPAVLAGNTGATLTFHRSQTLSSQATTLAERLDAYLQRGPLRQDRHWSITTAATDMQFDGYPALQVVVEGSETEGALTMRSEIYSIQSAVDRVYILTLTAPLADWQQAAPLMYAIRDSIDIHQ